MPALITIPRVPLIKTGTYALGSGDKTFTLDDLYSAVKAVNDPGVRNPVLKFGHNAKQITSKGSKTQQPCVGRVMNLEVDADTETLFGDYVGVPEWLAEILPIAYPDRSVEGYSQVVTSTGRSYEFVLSAVSLLGEEAPGVDTLEDLFDLFYGDGELVTAGRLAVKLQGGGMATKIAATVEVEDVRRSYYESLPQDSWWWIRSVRLDPNELIVDDDNGTLYRVPFEIAGDEVTFGEATEVRVVYQDVAAEAALRASHAVAVFASRAESRPETKEPAHMSKITERLGLPEDASEEDILAALDAQGVTPEKDPPDPEVEETEETEEETETTTIPDGMVLMDAETARQLQLAASQGQAAFKRLDDEDRDKFLSDAVQAGKFPRSRKAHYASLYEKDPKGTRAFIDQLAAGAIPVSERGTETSMEGVGGTEEPYPVSWFPEVAARKAAGQHTVVTRPAPGTIAFEEA